MLQQLEIDWDNITHTKENNSHSEQILFDQYPRLNNNCRKIFVALMKGERLTGKDIMRRLDMSEYRKRISDLRDAGIVIQEKTLKGGAKQWWIEND